MAYLAYNLVLFAAPQWKGLLTRQIGVSA